ncbi:phosphoglycerate dehydrogenase [Azospirillum sp. ST 5-10]|uniref:phosphoglycerate dehydrogenase n=1 Tax=unclassified Azospirillum TaxID=2630922 RepID=UPI003F49FDA0
MTATVAVLSRSFSAHPVLRAELLARHPGARFNDSGRTLAGAELLAFLRGSERAVVALERIDEPLLAALPELRVISKYGVGLDNVDLAAAQRHGKRVGWTAGVNRRSVAELVIAFAIALLRHVPQAHRGVLAGTWRQWTGRQLSDRTVGIVGCGHVGKDVALLLRAFGCRVLAHDIRDFPSFYAAHGVEPRPLEALLREAEVVTLHLPLTERTRGLFDAARLALLRPDAVLINTARGGIVDEAALARALAEDRLAGAAFDVFGVEPPQDTALLHHPNFLVTPHIGGSAAEAILAMGRAAIAGLDDAREAEEFLPDRLIGSSH